MVEPVGALGHEVSIVTRSKDITPFAGGFIEGRWVKTNGKGGQFKGRWINSTGENAGHIKGIWGVNRFGISWQTPSLRQFFDQMDQWGYEKNTRSNKPIAVFVDDHRAF